MNDVEKFVTGVIAIGLITAFGLHATGIATLAQSVGKSAGSVESTAIKG